MSAAQIAAAQALNHAVSGARECAPRRMKDPVRPETRRNAA
jgi:hypothetical protein